MKKGYFLLIAVLVFFQSQSQLLNQEQLLPPQKRCATYEVIEGMRRLYPGGPTDADFEAWIAQKIQEQHGMRLTSTVTLPVIFHIIHDGDAEGTGDNVSQAAVQQQMLQLNKDYANLSNSPYAVAADMEIQFALAQNDPLGTPLAQPGIERINRTSKGFTAPPYTVGYGNPANNYLNSTIKPATIWDPNNYINIWVLEMESGILGIATLPATSTTGLSGLPGSESSTTAGIAVLPSSLGSMFTPSGGCSSVYTRGKTLTHEMGHFFGLRHIWGDGNCATDYCGDTPVHQTSNSGVPVHPKSNSCGTLDEMFENYMDYTDDIAMNTFTADQKARMQAVLLNSPLRTTLPSSTAGLVGVTATNRIAFTTCSGTLTVSETGLTGTYPRYRDVSLNLNVEDKATGNATVTINTGGTAVANVDYQLMTPSLSFVAGDDYKPVNIRILDNALVDGNRTIIISYTISGTGVTAGSSAQTMTITIVDDDNITISSTPVTLLSQDFEGSVAGWSSLSSGGMPNLFRISNGGDAGGSGNCAYISNSTMNPYANAYTKTTAGLAVLRTPIIDASGFSDISVSFKYKVWGDADMSDVYDYGALSYSTQAAPLTFNLISGAGPYAGISAIASGNPTVNLPNSTFAHTSFYLGLWWENDNILGTDPGFNVDDIVITAMGTQIETAISSSYGYDVQSGAGVNNFQSTNGKGIAMITGLNQNISGLTAAVTQSGTGTSPLLTNAGAFSRSQKVITLVPSVANTTAQYQCTFYFTVGELSPAWSGVDIPNLKILKVKDGVNLSGTIGSANAEVITPVFSDNSANGFYSYTATFTGGFSQFMLVSPATVLPVELITFDAKPSGRSIVLNWSTAQELNNKGFAIERSTDAVNFEKIGWHDGRVNSESRTDYLYTDHFVQPGIVYYYRLRQTDIDLREKLSVVRQAKLEKNGILLSVTPNPATDRLNIYISGSLIPADVTLFSMQGQMIKSWKKVNASAAPYQLNIAGIASGVYMLQVQLPSKKLFQKVIIR